MGPPIKESLKYQQFYFFILFFSLPYAKAEILPGS